MVIVRNVVDIPAPIKNLRLSYAMIGNAVSVESPFRFATLINKDFKDSEEKKWSRRTGEFKSFDELSKAKKDKS